MLLNCGVGDSFESPLDWKQIKPINPKGKQPWIFFESINAEAPILCQLIQRVAHWKRHWCWERLRAGRERGNRGWDGWHHQFNKRDFKQTLGDSEGQQSLASYSPWGCRVRHNWVTKQQKFVQPESHFYFPSNIQVFSCQTLGQVFQFWLTHLCSIEGHLSAGIGQDRKGQWRDGERQGNLEVLQSMGLYRVRDNWETEHLSTMSCYLFNPLFWKLPSFIYLFE